MLKIWLSNVLKNVVVASMAAWKAVPFVLNNMYIFQNVLQFIYFFDAWTPNFIYDVKAKIIVSNLGIHCALHCFTIIGHIHSFSSAANHTHSLIPQVHVLNLYKNNISISIHVHYLVLINKQNSILNLYKPNHKSIMAVF